MRPTLKSLIVAALLVATTVGAWAEPMVASWYGPGQGTTTADGERFEPDGIFVAHKTLPFGTCLVLTLGRHSLVAFVNDRGPYVDGRDLDLSRGAARQLHMLGRGVAVVDARPCAHKPD